MAITRAQYLAEAKPYLDDVFWISDMRNKYPIAATLNDGQWDFEVNGLGSYQSEGRAMNPTTLMRDDTPKPVWDEYMRRVNLLLFTPLREPLDGIGVRIAPHEIWLKRILWREYDE